MIKRIIHKIRYRFDMGYRAAYDIEQQRLINFLWSDTGVRPHSHVRIVK
jgi:hypothetical protein